MTPSAVTIRVGIAMASVLVACACDLAYGIHPVASAPEPSDASSATEPAVDAGGGFSDARDVGTRERTEAFEALEIRHALAVGTYLTQCARDAGTQRVWRVVDGGTDAGAALAAPVYAQRPDDLVPCGSAARGEYPIVALAAADALPPSVYVIECIAPAEHAVYVVDRLVAGHPAASFGYPETTPSCP